TRDEPDLLLRVVDLEADARLALGALVERAAALAHRVHAGGDLPLQREREEPVVSGRGIPPGVLPEVHALRLDRSGRRREAARVLLVGLLAPVADLAEVARDDRAAVFLLDRSAGEELLELGQRRLSAFLPGERVLDREAVR